MCEVIRKTDKPCIVFKVLAAGRLIGSSDQIRSELEFALTNIKASDVLLLGMYQKLNDQIGENAEIVSSICEKLADGDA